MSFLNQGSNQYQVIKSADDTVNNSTVLTADSELTAALSSEYKYHIQGFLLYNSNTTADFKFRFDFSAETKHSGNITAVSLAGTPTLTVIDIYSGNPLYTATVTATGDNSFDMIISFDFWAYPVADSTLTVKFAQNTANVSDSKLLTGSRLTIEAF